VLAAGRAAFAAGVERFCQADEAFAVTSALWDPDPILLGTPGGTVDLRTGSLRPARQADHITRSAAVAPAETADCATWLAFLEQATGGDRDLVGFLRRWFGYCLTGLTQEHALLFVYGPGGNGKGVLLNTVAAVMGSYATTAAMDTFTATQGDRHPADLAMPHGARTVMTTETEEGRAWAEARIKALTGGDPITARFMRRDFFTFTPAFKLTISGNHKPALRNVDDAARRRFNVVPFMHRPESPDSALPEKLRAEFPGILRWLIEGCREWQAQGLARPAVVSNATAEYFSDQDVLAQWVEEGCELGKDLADTNASLFGSWRALRAGPLRGAAEREVVQGGPGAAGLRLDQGHRRHPRPRLQGPPRAAAARTAPLAGPRPVNSTTTTADAERRLRHMRRFSLLVRHTRARARIGVHTGKASQASQASRQRARRLKSEAIDERRGDCTYRPATEAVAVQARRLRGTASGASVTSTSPSIAAPVPSISPSGTTRRRGAPSRFWGRPRPPSRSASPTC
jgi:P4 family phage/plasmid primase-like protien